MTIVDEVSDGVKCEEFAEVIKIDEGKVRRHVEEVVRQSVEETLNGLLEAEADELCGAKRYERNVERLDTRAGHYERKLQTKAGEVNLKVPRLRSMRAAITRLCVAIKVSMADGMNVSESREHALAYSARAVT